MDTGLKAKVKSHIRTMIILEKDLWECFSGSPTFVMDQVVDDIAEFLILYAKKFPAGQREHGTNLDSLSQKTLEQHLAEEKVDEWAYFRAIARKKERVKD